MAEGLLRIAMVWNIPVACCAWPTMASASIPTPTFPATLGCPMRERTAAVGGTLEIASAPGAGTRLSVRVPVAARS